MLSYLSFIISKICGFEDSIFSDEGLKKGESNSSIIVSWASS